MLTNKINALRYLESFFKLMQEDELAPRFSILDALVLLHINEHPGCAKSDLVEIVYGSRDANKSSMDRPLDRLERFGLIAVERNQNAYTRSGAPRTSYNLSAEGISFLETTQTKKK